MDKNEGRRQKAEGRNRKAERGRPCCSVVCCCLVSAVLSLGGCGPKPVTALGRLREVTVATDYWGEVEPVIRRILQDTALTPQPEPAFSIRTYSGHEFERYRLLRTVFLIGTVSDTVVRTVLGARVDSLPATGYGVFQIPNAWADNQQLVVFAAAADSLLIPGLEAYGPRLKTTFRKIVLANIERAVYFRGREEREAAEMRERYSFELDVPKGWHLKKEAADSNFVYMFTHYPDRGVFVFWQDTVRLLADQLMLDLRDSLTRLHYDGDRVERSYVIAETVGFLDGPAIRLQGVWQNDREALGGPFVSYAFNHEGRFFLIDGLVFNPGKDKLDHLLQVEVIVRSFTPR